MADDDRRIIHVDFRARHDDKLADKLAESVREALEQLAEDISEEGGDEALGQLGQTLVTLGAGMVAQAEGMDELGRLLKDLAVALQLHEAKDELDNAFPEDDDYEDF